MTPEELLAEALVEAYPADAAGALERLGLAEVAALLGELAPARAAAVVARMEAAFAAGVLAELPAGAGAAIAAGLPPTAAAVVLRRMPAGPRDALLAACPPGFAAQARALLAAPARTAGAVMDPHAPSLPRDLTAAAACAALREHPDRFKHYVYVVDRGGVLVGVTRPIDLIAAPPEAVLEDLMRRPVVRIGVDELEVAVVGHPGWASYRSLPIVDRDQRLVGVIRDEVVQPLRHARGAQGAPISLAVSLAELFWLGLTGVTEGVASVVGREAGRDRRPAPEGPAPEGDK